MDLQKLLDTSYEYGRKYIHKGKVASYIPDLAKEDVSRVAGAIFTKEGHLCTVGDFDYQFSMQSIVKVVIYLLVLEHYDFSTIRKYVGVKPSAKPYNSIIELELSNKNIPVNPFINAGAIVSTYLLYQKYGEDTFDVILNRVREVLLNDQLMYSESLYKSERSSAFANKALTYMMLNDRIISSDIDVDKLLDVYFKACSILVSTVDLARMGLVLSLCGMNLAGEKIISKENARILRSLMATCGTYDYAGNFAIRVGVPAKSGVGGGIVAAVKSGYGIATYSPGLDTHGNSYVGMRILYKIAKSLNLSIY